MPTSATNAFLDVTAPKTSLTTPRIPRSAAQAHPTGGGAWQGPTAVVALILAAVLAWANSFDGPFVFDDRPAILGNPSLESLASALSPPRDGGTVAGRPLVNVSLALNHAWSGPEVAAYHVTNLLIHILAGLTLFGLVRRTLRSCSRPDTATAIAFSAALLWLVHPLQTAAVTYVVQRAESLMGLFFLLTLYAFARATLGGGAETTASPSLSARPGARRWLTLSVLACLAGMACKEVMAAAPLVVLLYDRAFVSGSFRAALRTRPGFHGALASTWLLLGGLVAANAGRAGTAGFSTAISPGDYALTQCAAIVRYLRLALWPDELVFDYGTNVVAGPAAVWPQLLVVALLLVGTAVALRRAPRGGFLAASFFLILAPSSSVLPVATQTIAEHRMYLPLAALTLGAALGSAHLLRHRAVLLIVPVAVALGVATSRRNADYDSALTLWRDSAAKQPGNPRAHNNVGNEFARAGDSTGAEQHYRLALALAPADAEVHNNLGNVLVKLDRDAEARGHFERSVALNPESFAAQLNLAHAALRAGHHDQAIVHFEAAAKLNRLDAEALCNHAIALAESGQVFRAMARYREALQLDPSHARTLYNLGVALARSADYEEAAAVLSRALQRDPQNVGAAVNLGNALLLSRRPADAASAYEIALRLKPGDPQIQANLARAQAMSRRDP